MTRTRNGSGGAGPGAAGRAFGGGMEGRIATGCQSGREGSASHTCGSGWQVRSDCTRRWCVYLDFGANPATIPREVSRLVLAAAFALALAVCGPAEEPTAVERLRAINALV